MRPMTYIELLDDGRYEYGHIVKGEDRKNDRKVPEGIANTHEDAERELAND